MSIHEEFSHLVSEYTQDILTFDFKSQMIKALESLTRDQVNEFFVQHMITAPRRMYVKLMSDDHKEKNVDEIKDAKERKKQ